MTCEFFFHCLALKNTQPIVSQQCIADCVRTFFLPKLSNVECLKWRLKLLIAANKTLAGYILWVVLCPSCWWGDWGVIIAALTAPWLAGGGRLLSSGRHLDNRQVTTCCKPRAGPGIGWDQARLATAGYYRPGPGDGCQENMSSLQTSSQYFHVLSIGINYTEDLIHSGQSWLFIFLAVAQVQYISGVIINGPVMSLLSLSNFTEQPSRDQE